jgi:CheY-like chemotaxis protein
MTVARAAATVLVVDDSMSNRELARAVMHYAGYKTLQARDGATALTLLKTEKVDVVLADIMMPDMDGYDLARTIHTDPKMHDLPVVFYTAHYEAPGSLQRAEAVGVTHIVPKTGELSALVDSVHDALAPAC